MKTLASEWKDFSRCIHPQAPKRQIEEMQMAFYAGALSLHRMMLDGVTAGEEVQDADIKMMENIEKEFQDFNDLLKVRGAMR